MDAGMLRKVFGIGAGRREQSKLLHAPPTNFVLIARRTAATGVSAVDRATIAGVSVAGRAVDCSATTAGVSITGRAVTTGISVTGPVFPGVAVHVNRDTRATIANRFMIISFRCLRFWRFGHRCRRSMPSAPKHAEGLGAGGRPTSLLVRHNSHTLRVQWGWMRLYNLARKIGRHAEQTYDRKQVHEKAHGDPPRFRHRKLGARLRQKM
jgi:hypothetical protein